MHILTRALWFISPALTIFIGFNASWEQAMWAGFYLLVGLVGFVRKERLSRTRLQILNAKISFHKNN